ncbi:hypothetical protein [Leptolyngbya sp. 7M]|uniref:hypothetical protein n=1 Tax=Leptolyngbya sp. 7M TaxID=2812896 RepID=UPI001B8CAA25|nr:hypothetical protein [Leptolyngbya sp. 7M]QYO65285.1 hypothetical protein JVX88_00425 [Leptolyngbya sp. 7M]
MKQIIAFIAPDKFARLLRHEKAKAIGFLEYTDDDTDYLNGGDHVFYVNGPGKYESACFDQDKAEKAFYILVPDALNDFDEYEPKHEFAILYHHETEIHRNVAEWTQNRSFFRGNRREHEEAGTIYAKIGSQITSSKEWNFEIIWSDLTSEFYSQSVDQLLQTIKEAESVSDTMLPPVLSAYERQFKDFISEIQGRFESDNPSHQTALNRFQEALFA